jgi:16S rRNA (uracil1498-N3)-methyltransferase
VNEALRGSVAHLFRDTVDHPIGTALPLGGDAHHLETVLRVRPGAPVTVSDGRGRWVSTTYRGGAQLTVESEVHDVPSRPAPLTIAFAPVKGERADWTVEKLVETGIDRVVVLAPLRRSVVTWDAERVAVQQRKLRRTALAAAAQSRRVHLPEVEVGVALGALAGPGAAVAEPGNPRPGEGTHTVVVGPEGGFDPEEIAGWAKVGLGDTILRAETAAVAAAVLMVTHSAHRTDHTE